MGVCSNPLSIIMEMLNMSLVNYLINNKNNIEAERKKQFCLGVARGINVCFFFIHVCFFFIHVCLIFV